MTAVHSRADTAGGAMPGLGGAGPAGVGTRLKYSL